MARREFDPGIPERMDLPQPVSRELESDLENLAGINRQFGGSALIRYFMRRWLEPKQTHRIIDLCTGSGDLPRLMVDLARARDVKVAVEAIDFQASTVEIARRLSAGYPEISFREGDVRFIDAEPADIVICSLALHHFSDDDAVQLLRRCRELSRGRTLVADLRRGWSAAAGVWVITELLYREPMTRHDARLSVRRSFSSDELKTLARDAGWDGFKHANFPIARQAIWLE